jgi:sterol desaturase/sphingolipid hydroxylase (fatty acid hydroxylase superfamily)
MSGQSKEGQYDLAFPEEGLRFNEHFSSLLLSGDVGMTLLELATLSGLTVAAFKLPAERVNVVGSMTLKELALFGWTKAIVTRLYNTYCEAVFFACPQYRIQPSREHALQQKKDLCGRKKEELSLIHSHDRMTLLSQFAFNVGIYYLLPGYYPAPDTVHSWQERILRLLGNHYILSFGMYWMHRSLHVVPFLWDKIHSYHHWAKHPLSRNTYQDHWFDNFCNAIVGHCWATILIPLDHKTFWFSQFFRVFESLEKHSGVSCSFNLAHTMQRWLPFAQMPHHHDWHHEGHKGSNYTFSSVGGIWDCIFGTRKAGRANELKPEHTTRYDKSQVEKKGRAKTLLDNPLVSLLPVAGVGVAVAFKLREGKGAIKLRV